MHAAKQDNEFHSVRVFVGAVYGIRSFDELCQDPFGISPVDGFSRGCMRKRQAAVCHLKVQICCGQGVHFDGA
jgi:hypothetical protein